MTKQTTDPIIIDILKWHNNNKYIRIGSDVSVTEIMNAPQQVHLRNRHRPKIISTNLGDDMAAISGTAVHRSLQHYLRIEGNVSGRWLIERKMTSVIDGVRVAGKFDALRDLEHLYDIKTTRVWKYIFGGVKEFEQQLNLYDYMLFLDGYDIKTLTIMMYMWDWQAGKVWEKGYPKERIMILPIPKWDRNVQKLYMESRVDAWKQAEHCTDSTLPECTFDERWAEKEVFKLYRLPSAQKASKVFNTMTGAKSYQSVCEANEPAKWSTSVIKTFRSKPWKRCESWCSVADFCHQYKNR